MSILERIKDEPTLVTGLVGAVLLALAEFGAPLTSGQETAVQGLTLALMALIARRKVVPVSKTVTVEEIVDRHGRVLPDIYPHD